MIVIESIHVVEQVVLIRILQVLSSVLCIHQLLEGGSVLSKSRLSRRYVRALI